VPATTDIPLASSTQWVEHSCRSCGEKHILQLPYTDADRRVRWFTCNICGARNYVRPLYDFPYWLMIADEPWTT
jgi:predicted RNA-binding Zn-ribbon protein involved in translation (DUF1610 family)